MKVYSWLVQLHTTDRERVCFSHHHRRPQALLSSLHGVELILLARVTESHLIIEKLCSDIRFVVVDDSPPTVFMQEGLF